ncbi:MAG: hypothetical protein K6G00_12915 [Treponema sp.]|nr:hypothetical protein [Treponema sp.]
MNKILKRIVVSALCLFAASFIFAADKSLGITSSDVSSYIENCSSIRKEIDDLEYNDKSMEREPTKEEIQKRDEILKKYGISGPSRFEKTERILQYSQYWDFCNSPKVKKEEKAQIINMMNEKDYKVIEPKAKEVLSAVKKADRAGQFNVKDSLNLPSFKFKKNKK